MEKLLYASHCIKYNVSHDIRFDYTTVVLLSVMVHSLKLVIMYQEYANNLTPTFIIHYFFSSDIVYIN